MSGLLLVVPCAEDGVETRRLLALAKALAGMPEVDLTTLLWAGGPLADAFAAVGPTVDAGAVNTWGPAQALTRARLTPAARLAKNRRLRGLLAPLAEVSAIVVGGLAALPALEWLPRPRGRTAVVLRSSALGTSSPEAVEDLELLVAADADAVRWLAGLPAERIRRHTLLEGPEPGAVAPERIGLVGWSADEVGRIVAGRAAIDPGVAVTWFVDEALAWGLWQGPTASPLARQVRLAPLQAHTGDLADLALLVVGEPDPATTELGALAATWGTPVRTTGPDAVDEAIAAPVTSRTPTGDVWTAGVAAGAAALAIELAGEPAPIT